MNLVFFSQNLLPCFLGLQVMLVLLGGFDELFAAQCKEQQQHIHESAGVSAFSIMFLGQRHLFTVQRQEHVLIMSQLTDLPVGSKKSRYHQKNGWLLKKKQKVFPKTSNPRGDILFDSLPFDRNLTPGLKRLWSH